MALLAEIYALDRLKLNLKFEIEMVFRNLGLQVQWPCQVQRHTVLQLMILTRHAVDEMLGSLFPALVMLPPSSLPAVNPEPMQRCYASVLAIFVTDLQHRLSLVATPADLGCQVRRPARQADAPAGRRQS